MSRVAVDQRVLRWALNRSIIPRSKLEKRFPLGQWLSGERLPTLRQLESLASATRTPLGYFFLDAPPEEPMPIPFFRTMDDQVPLEDTPDLIETLHIVQMRQEWMKERAIELGQDPLWFVGSASPESDHRQVANEMRAALGMNEGWADRFSTWEKALDHLKASMEAIGVFVVINGVVQNNPHRALDPEMFRGFVLVDEYAPFVFVNGADAKAAQMFTLAHELAHVFLGHSAAFDLKTMHPADHVIETTCNRIAAEFLVPEDELRQAWPDLQREVAPYEAAARQFKVSSLVVARRLLDLELISKEDFYAFYSWYRENALRDPQRNSGGNFYYSQNNRVGKRFFMEVLTALREGVVSYTEAYRLTGMHGRTFHGYAELLMSGGGAS